MKGKVVKPTKKQLRLLRVLNPHQERKIAQVEAAKILGITLRAVEYRMSNLKRRCPDIYLAFKQLRKEINAGQRLLNYPKIMDPVEINKLYKHNRVKEVF